MLPLIGFGFCLLMWLGLPLLSKLVGSAWLLIGLTYYAIKTKGFRVKQVLFSFEEK